MIYVVIKKEGDNAVFLMKGGDKDEICNVLGLNIEDCKWYAFTTTEFDALVQASIMVIKS